MAFLSITDEALARLKTLLAAEDHNACVRLRTYSCGTCCSASIILGLSIDELDESGDEVLATLHQIRFIAERDFSRWYGEKFSISIQDARVTLSVDAHHHSGRPEEM